MNIQELTLEALLEYRKMVEKTILNLVTKGDALLEELLNGKLRSVDTHIKFLQGKGV